MRRLQHAGYALVIVTNQSGLARGYFSEEQYNKLTRAMLDKLAHERVNLSGVYHCPHHPQGRVPALSIDCKCRKPEPGLVLQAARELGISLQDSILVGDKDTDLGAARAAGVGRVYRVVSDDFKFTSVRANADGYFTGLLDCIERIHL